MTLMGESPKTHVIVRDLARPRLGPAWVATPSTVVRPSLATIGTHQASSLRILRPPSSMYLGSAHLPGMSEIRLHGALHWLDRHPLELHPFSGRSQTFIWKTQWRRRRWNPALDDVMYASTSQVIFDICMYVLNQTLTLFVLSVALNE